ncbi:MAG: alcohol dehydrogenase catalytic domain-containing protein [Actinomycetaceae bacterium]|nr:alcohol dehydrogenase catalytic domain-containing protein [Actinomycetaceae bacterium]
MTMQAAVLGGINDLRLRDVPIPEVGPGEVLLKVEANTICGTDLRIISGAKTAGVRPGVIMGHEFAGRVADVGQGIDDIAIGTQATCSIVLSCGRCEACANNREHLCAQLSLFGYEIDGGLAEYMLIPRAAMERGNFIPVAEELPPTLLALAEPVSCCLNGAHQFNVQPGDTVVVLGTGPIGLIHCALARLAGASTIIASGRKGRLEPAERLGATHTTSATGDELLKEIRSITGGRGADVVIVAVGDLELAQVALEAAAIGGRVNYFAGFPKGSVATVDVNLIHYKELVVTGGSNARRADVAQAVRLLSSGALDLSPLVTHTFPLGELDAAITAVEQRSGLKVAVTP